MAKHSGTRQRTEALLEISNSILAAAIGGAWEEVDDLERQRAEMFEQVCGDREMSQADRIYLAGVVEHIRVVDATTRNFLATGPDELWLDAMGGGFDRSYGAAVGPASGRYAVALS